MLAFLWPGVRYGLGLMWIPVSDGGGYWGHAGAMNGYQIRGGVTPDGRFGVIVARTGNLAVETNEKAANRLIDEQFCAIGVS
jgi:D-alanyl-D-alanine carboxypeptidase